MINAIDHYNLRSDAKMIETLKDFYINIVGLKLVIVLHLKAKDIGFMQKRKMYFISVHQKTMLKT